MTQPPDARECARLLLQTIPALMRGIGGAMRQYKIGDEDEPLTIGQFRMLEMLSCGQFTLGDLAARHHVAPSTMSRAIDVLVRRDWVRRQSDPGDRRQVILTLTDGGRAAHAAMRLHTQDVVARLIEQIGGDERARLYDGLSILRTLLETTADDRPPTTDGS